MGPDIALAASARDWPDRLHRHLLDHGGGRVVSRVMGPEQAVDGRYDVLLIDDISSFLTPRLVTAVKGGGADVIGVFSPSDGSDAKRRLLECGISDVIETEANPEEFLEKISSTIAHRLPPTESPAPARRATFLIGVTGPTHGVGITEVAVTLSLALSKRVASVCLIDLDTQWPSVAQRLDLPLHPNIRTVLDRVMHEPDRVTDAIHRILGLSIVGGVADLGRGSPLSHPEVTMLFESVAAGTDVLIADLGPYGNAVSGATRALDTLLVVGTAEPVGMARLLRTIDHIQASPTPAAVLVVVNKTPGQRFHDSEVRRQIIDSYPVLPVVTLPFDHRLSGLSWAGVPMSRGRFVRSVGRIAKLIAESVGS